MSARALRRFRAPRTTGMSMYCFPGAGAGASSFRRWSAVVNGKVDVVSVQMPGREDRLHEPAAVSIEEAVDSIVPALAADIDGPYVLVGHSMGAYHAFACARRLAALDAPQPQVLVLAGARPPIWDAGADPNDTDHALRDHLRRLGGTPEEVLNEPELMDLLLPTLRADLRAVRGYTPSPSRLPVRAVVLAGAGDALAPPSGMQGWGTLLEPAPEVLEMPGGHFFVHEGPVIEEIVGRVL